MKISVAILMVSVPLILATAAAAQGQSAPAAVEHRTCKAPDGVTIAYSVAGTANTALVFIHGGLADRTFYTPQLTGLSSRYKVVAIDLAGHGESGRNRQRWGIPEFAADVKAVLDAERLERVILFGNSLGGPVVVEAALLAPGRVAGVVGIDTFQDLGAERNAAYVKAETAEIRQRRDAFRKDYAAGMKAMVGMLFHKDADPALMADVERRMLRTKPEVADALFSSLIGYDYTSSVRKLKVPLRAINGDLYPLDVAAARKMKADFDLIVMPHVGHYPMLEQPAAFNRHVQRIAEDLLR